MGEDYKELHTSAGKIGEILTTEEEAFNRTLKRGGNILNNLIEKAQKSPEKQITGEDAFKLKDTYGFPLEEVLLIAKDSGLQVNLDAYQLLEEQAKEKSRSAHVTHAQEVEQSLFQNFVKEKGESEFLGYDEITADGTIMGIVVDGKFVERMEEGMEGMIVLDRTPFYAEKGGQVGDTGILDHHSAHFTVQNCHTPYPGVIVHLGKLEKGTFLVGEPVTAKVTPERRQSIANNHTTTHLLHWALQTVLGGHIKQAGSLVESDRFRFDFNHHKALTTEEIRNLEKLVNEKIREGRAVHSYETSFESIQRDPDIKQFFGDKYGATVRVVDIDYSKELCGGTHTRNVGTIGFFKILKEGSIASGVRRIEAITGAEAEKLVYAIQDVEEAAAKTLKVPPQKILERVESLVEENKLLSQELKAFKRASLKHLSADLVKKKRRCGSIECVIEVVSVDSDALGELAEQIQQHLHSGVILLGNQEKERCQLIAKVSSDLTQKGVRAVDLVKEVAPLVGGSGGEKQTKLKLEEKIQMGCLTQCKRQLSG